MKTLRDFLRLGISGQPGDAVITGIREPVGYQQLVEPASSTKLTIPVAAAGKVAQFAVIQNNGTVACRWRDDGTAPTAAVGMVLNAGSELDYVGDVANIAFIRTAAGVTLDVSLYY